MKNFTTLLLVSIVAAGAFIRLIGLGELPSVLNRDEAALAVTAQFIQATGADEHGHRWPLNVKSFGDWKLAVYSYILIPFFQIFGAHDWVVRLPSALMGIAMIAGVWVLLRQLVQAKHNLAWGAAFLLAFSPWSLHVSRVAYEGHLAAGFCLAAVLLFLKSLQPGPKTAWLFVAASCCALLSMLSYHAFQVVVPVLGLGLVLVYRQEFWQRRTELTLPISISVSIGILVAGIFLLDGLFGANTQKFANISVFAAKNYQPTIIAKWGSLPIYWGRAANIYSNYWWELGLQIVRNIFSLLDLRFLFLQGGSEPLHRFPGAGLFHLFELITLSIGLGICFRQRTKSQLTLLLWLAAAVIPALITLQPQHPIRLLGALVPLTCISALGLVTVGEFLQNLKNNRQKKLAVILVGSSIALSLFFTLITYFYYFKRQQYAHWPWYMPQVVAVGEEAIKQPAFKHIVFQGTSLSPYVFYLWYGRYDFATAAVTLEYYPPDEGGFEHVKQLGQLKFEQVDWPAIEKRNEQSLFIVRKSELPPDKLDDDRYDIQQEISQPNSELSYVVVVFKP